MAAEPRCQANREAAPAAWTDPEATFYAMSDQRQSAAGTQAPADPAELQVSRLRAVRGPNFWRLAPVIACDVRPGALEDVTSAEMDGFAERLLA
ncbi:MAG TPA: hypothetical protein VFH27_08535, partial [Longimicrobiaceae bacterium]|nr:hypothetical protein [Longimicrobiaceae bacterium]